MPTDLAKGAFRLLAEIALYRGGEKRGICPYCDRMAWDKNHTQCIATLARLFLDRNETEIALLMGHRPEPDDRFMKALHDICGAGG